MGCSDGEAPNQTSTGGATGVGGSNGSGGTTVSTGGSAGSAGAGTTGGATASGGSSGAGVGGASAGSGVVGGSSSGGAMPGGSPATGGASTTGGSAGAGGTAGAAAGSGGATGGTGGSAGAVTLNQMGNFIYDQLETYKTWLSTASGDAAKLTADRRIADNMLSWQIPNGGFDKRGIAGYAAAWNGSAPRSAWTGANGVEVGTIDNDATVTEIMFLADVYKRSGNTTTYRDGARRALDFILAMQYASGGFPQVLPARENVAYSSYVTFNDDAMARALVLLLQVTRQVAPLDGDLFTADQRTRAATAITKGVAYILAAQISQNNVKTVWCAQHDPTSYAPMGARSYELASKSGKESIGVIGFLMTQPQTAEIAAAVHAAIAWFRSDAVRKADTAYVSRPSSSTDDNYNPIQSRAGSSMWCRFYEVAQDRCFFSGRLATDNPPGNGKQYDIMAIEPERRYGYEWGGAYGTRLFTYTDSVGY